MKNPRLGKYDRFSTEIDIDTVKFYMTSTANYIRQIDEVYDMIEAILHFMRNSRKIYAEGDPTIIECHERVLFQLCHSIAIIMWFS